MGKVDSFRGEYAFLSNFYPCPIVYDWLRYSSVEHAYQAAKTLNMRERAKICVLHEASDAKREGGNLQLRDGWAELKVPTMELLVRQKFDNCELSNKLLATGDAELVEGNWWGDTFWGVCRGVGENQLGKILMRVRTALTGRNF